MNNIETTEDPDGQVADLWRWVEGQTKGSAWIVKVEIVKAS